MKKTLKDNELENVSGGTWKEIKELREALRLNADIKELERILRKHNIYCDISEDQYGYNDYYDIENKKVLTHQEVIELIKNNRWRN